jgi:hypothetical protein
VRGSRAARVLILFCASGAGGWAQRRSDLRVPTPIREGETLVLGFLGGREPWDNDQRGARRLALELRALGRPDLHVETLANRKRGLAVELIGAALDRDRDGRLDPGERTSARVVLYGQSFGGAAVVKLARRLHRMDVPVLLTVQVDSVGLGDAVIPPNVRTAANLYQREGWIIRGEPEIRTADPSRTRILGNFRYDYRGKHIDLSGVSWLKKLFRHAHTKMDFDPDVWAHVRRLILDAVSPEIAPPPREPPTPATGTSGVY